MRGFSIIGFVIGAIVAIIFYVVFTAVLNFRHEDLVAGLIALLLWLGLTFGYAGPTPRA